MKTVYSAPNLSLVSIVAAILTEEGITCRIRNEYLFAGMGEIPPIECWPQLCVEDADYPSATRIVKEALAQKEMPKWRCSSCGEELEGQFTACWKCGTSRV